MKRPPRPTQLHPVRFTDADLRRMRLESELDHAHIQAAEARDEVERISSEHLRTVLRLPSAERAAHVDDPELVMADRQAVVASLAGSIIVDPASIARSGARLQELLRLPLHLRFDHLDDGVLIPADKTALRRSLMAKLRHRTNSRWREWWFRRRRALRMSLGRSFLHPALWLTLGLGGIWFGSAWSHTPRFAYSERAQPVDLFGPKGFVTSYTFTPRTLIAIQELKDDGALVRIWLPGQGFLYGTLPQRELVVMR